MLLSEVSLLLHLPGFDLDIGGDHVAHWKIESLAGALDEIAAQPARCLRWQGGDDDLRVARRIPQFVVDGEHRFARPGDFAYDVEVVAPESAANFEREGASSLRLLDDVPRLPVGSRRRRGEHREFGRGVGSCDCLQFVLQRLALCGYVAYHKVPSHGPPHSSVAGQAVSAVPILAGGPHNHCRPAVKQRVRLCGGRARA